jgi:hypothetical protein
MLKSTHDQQEQKPLRNSSEEKLCWSSLHILEEFSLSVQQAQQLAYGANKGNM